MSPYLPAIPTDSLHKFVAIAGLVLAIVPPAYLWTLSTENALDAIHLSAEVKIVELKYKNLHQESQALIATYRQITRRANTLKAPSMPVTSAQRLALLNQTAMDSASAAEKQLHELEYQSKIALIRVREKQEVLSFKQTLVDIFRDASWSFVFVGSIISFIGFAWWYGKEGAPHWVKNPAPLQDSTVFGNSNQKD
ncbi:hypothetical protein [Hymenobacter terrenus]|uniref:hypothetical protein n=1 Tax=Hymenobacter terrenus TaxID=1629124 RepID=UPI0006190C6D|nr:hypothetical protein [Hymenobacter terrenus]